MKQELNEDDVFGFIKPNVDVHTMGMYSMSNLLRECGYKVVIASEEISEALENIEKLNNYDLIKHWVKENNITYLGFSYRLDPKEGNNYFLNLYERLKADKLIGHKGCQLKGVSLAALPDTCELVKQKLGLEVVYFPGDETPLEALQKYNVPQHKYPKSIVHVHEYDKLRRNFAKKLIENENWKLQAPLDHLGYKECGTDKDSFLHRLNYAYRKHTLPIIRTHSGPYSPDREECLKEYNSWCRELAQSELLDVLSIGSSQLTQSHFGENWEGKPNGGGVPVNSALEYRIIKQNASPMLVRTYSGTKNVPELARIHEDALNISWHALSFWWFDELDGRGDNTLLENLKEHFDTVRYIASTGKPVEPNVPHHFAFRGSDDVSYILSGYLAAKACKKLGIKDIIVQIMLNTPKYTWGVQDLAKARCLLQLVKGLEDQDFHAHLQTRAGLDYFAPDLDEAKVQLAEVTCLMDDIDPNNENSPEIIHVVNYSEAVRLATPPIIKDSIKITLNALAEWRQARKNGKIPNMVYNVEVKERFESLYHECRAAIQLLEDHIPNLYTPQGFETVFKEGFFPVPYLMDANHKWGKATKWKTAVKNGSVKVVDENGLIIGTEERYNKIIDEMNINLP